jgi:multidrug efflux pump
VPALIETPEDVANLPVRGWAECRGAGARSRHRALDLSRTPTTIARLDGKPAIVLEVKKRIGANVVETIEGAKKVAEQFLEETRRRCTACR